MATPDTSDRHIASDARAVEPTGLETIVPPYVTGLVIIGLAASFLAVIVGLAIGRFVVVTAGSFALSAVMLAWAIAAAVGLWKSVKNWLASRRADTSEAADIRLSQ